MTTYNINNSYFEKKIDNLILNTAREDYLNEFWEVDFQEVVSDIINDKYNYILHYDYKIYNDINFNLNTLEIDDEEACKLIKNSVPAWLYNFMEKVGIFFRCELVDGYKKKVESELLNDIEVGWRNLYDYVSADVYIEAVNELKKEGKFKGYEYLKKEVITALQLLEDKLNEAICECEDKISQFLSDTDDYVYSDDFFKDFVDLYDDIETLR